MRNDLMWNPVDVTTTAPCGADLKRMLQSDLASARAELDPIPASRTQAVHRARRRLKRARTILRLLRSVAGLDREHRLEPVRTAFALLAGARDADAMLAAGRWLLAHAEDVKDPALTTLLLNLEQNAHAQHRQSLPLAEILSLLRIAEAEAASLPEIFDGAKLFADGLIDTYRRGRACFRKCLDSSAPDDLHDWRKQVKHRLHLTQMVRGQPGFSIPLLKDLDVLAETLGEAHDFANLAALVGKAPELAGGRKAANEVKARIARRIAKLQRRAIDLGEELYGERTRHFVETVAALPSAP
eukprot:gene21384-22236_t